MCHCNPKIRTPNCGGPKCQPKTATQVDLESHQTEVWCRSMACDILSQYAHKMTLEELISESLKTGYHAAKKS